MAAMDNELRGAVQQGQRGNTGQGHPKLSDSRPEPKQALRVIPAFDLLIRPVATPRQQLAVRLGDAKVSVGGEAHAGVGEGQVGVEGEGCKPEL